MSDYSSTSTFLLSYAILLSFAPLLLFSADSLSAAFDPVVTTTQRKQSFGQLLVLVGLRKEDSRVQKSSSLREEKDLEGGSSCLDDLLSTSKSSSIAKMGCCPPSKWPGLANLGPSLGIFLLGFLQYLSADRNISWLFCGTQVLLLTELNMSCSSGNVWAERSSGQSLLGSQA
ncbi:hypothetical protein FGO68_gene8529 [Halteria grandinella]|uniref:Uncharacterized protein n=1 Tax=Halteria grandinella TaxID=5974 RepID=A0A8J8P4H6_HALGN|nr:hypothetical protein FGO68_gene8529 [Halteria grandinella]